MLYSHTIHSLSISVIPSYQEDLSNPQEEHYVWSYNVRVENQGNKPVKIISRKWKVIDAIAREENIIAPGVIGPAIERAQPLLKPGEAYEHTSEAHLATSSGIVLGTYLVKIGDGEVQEVEVPSFSLDIPDTRPRLH